MLGDLPSQRPHYTHVHLDENQVTDLDYTYAPGDQVTSLQHESADTVSTEQTHQPRVTPETHSGVTLPFLHQVGLCASVILDEMGCEYKYSPLIGCLGRIVIPIRTRSLTLTTAFL